MLDAPRTPGETVFEKYLKLQHIPFEFEKEHQGKSKRPDYTIEWEEHPVLFDVKDFGPPDLKGESRTLRGQDLPCDAGGRGWSRSGKVAGG